MFLDKKDCLRVLVSGQGKAPTHRPSLGSRAVQEAMPVSWGCSLESLVLKEQKWLPPPPRVLSYGSSYPESSHRHGKEGQEERKERMTPLAGWPSAKETHFIAELSQTAGKLPPSNSIACRASFLFP